MSDETTLIERVRARKHKLLERLNEFGAVSYQRYLYVVTTTLNQTTKTTTRSYTLISPNPKIYSVPERLIGMPLTDGGIVLSADDFICDHVNRATTESLFTAGVDHFLVAQSKAAPNSTPTGIRCRLIHLDDKSSFGWRLILRKLNDRDQR